MFPPTSPTLYFGFQTFFQIDLQSASSRQSVERTGFIKNFDEHINARNNFCGRNREIPRILHEFYRETREEVASVCLIKLILLIDGTLTDSLNMAFLRLRELVPARTRDHTT